MDRPSLSPEDAEQLVEELAVALEQLVDRSCADMAPLWLEATHAARLPLGPASGFDLGFIPSEEYLRLAKSGRSKYRTFAAWRHAVLWKGALDACHDWRDAVEVVYFTPYPCGRPPYAWSRSAAKAPGSERFESPTSLKNQAKEGVWHATQALLELLYDPPATERAEIEADVLRASTRESLTDTLKLEEHPPWRRNR